MPINKTKKMNLRECLDDNILDLSMSDLEEVPVKDIALIKKGTILDLSINKISFLTDDFAISLTHITKLDLSKNQLVSLPMNFGELIHLKHLDLYCNKLVNLPVSFGQMKALRWLDLKDNPLIPALTTVAGQCLDQQQCQTCARKIVLFMQDIQKKIEDVKFERALVNEQEKKTREPAQIQSKKKKKAGKNKDKKKEEVVKVAQEIPVEKAKNHVKQSAKPKSSGSKKNIKAKAGGSCLGKLFKLTFLFAFLIGVSLVTLRIVDRERFDALYDSSSKIWLQIVASLPPKVVEVGTQVVEASRPYAEVACQKFVIVRDLVITNIRDGYEWLSTSESFKHFLVQARNLWYTVSNWLVVSSRTFCDQIPVYIESFKKMIGK